MKNKIMSVVVSVSIFIPNILFAESTHSLSTIVSTGVIVRNNGNNLDPDGSSSQIDNLGENADSKTIAKAVILPDATWDIGDPAGLKLYFKTDPPIDEVGGFALDFGATYELQNSSIIETTFFITPFEKAYKNPYITGVEREETDSLRYGFRLGLQRMLGSGFDMELIYLKDDVDDDLIGALVPELKREGNVYSLNMNYSYYLSKSLELRPGISIRKGEYEGEANSFIKYKFDLETKYMLGRMMIIPSLYYSHSDYDEIHPIFDKTRTTDSYGARMASTYMAPFHFQNWSITGLIDLNKGDSNIVFYDTEAVTVGGLVNYHF